MPRPLESDRWLFGVTLALCLLGAVMIFSASAVTAEHQYGRPYIFLVRQAAWLVLGIFGMFALMRTDYRRLREPAVVCTAVCVVLLMLVGTFFLDKSHATHRWIKFGFVGFQPSELAKLAVILYLAWFLDLKRRNAAAMEFSKDDFLQTILPAVGPILLFVLADSCCSRIWARRSTSFWSPPPFCLSLAFHGSGSWWVVLRPFLFCTC